MVIQNIKTEGSKNSRFFATVFMVLFIFLSGYGQVTPFQKSVLDSLQANEFNVSLAFIFNSSQDGTNSITTGTDVGIMYSTKRSNYELVESAYKNRLENFSASDRMFVMLTCGLNSHDFDGKTIEEKRLYPEPFIMFSRDANRALNSRWQFGMNAVYAFKPTHIIRIKVGAGILYEKENWQMVKHEQVPYLDTFPQATQDYIFKTVGIGRDGSLLRDNIRANVYANFVCTFTKNISLNSFFDVQMPFIPPYHDLPQVSVFPVVTKLYPRLTMNMELTINILGKLNFVTAFSLQNDKGQIPLYVPDFVYSLNEGLQYSF